MPPLIPAASTCASFSYAVRADPVAEVLEGATAGELEAAVAFLHVLREHPGLLGDPSEDVVVLRGKPCDTDRVQPGGDRHGLLPVRAADATGEIDFLEQQTVGDDLVMCGRRNDELARRLVVRMVDHRQPLAPAIRPALAEDGPLAMHVVDQAQTVSGHAPVAHGYVALHVLPAPGAPNAMRSRPRCACTAAAPAAPVTPLTVIPLPFGSRREVEEHLAHAIRRHPQRGGALAGDLVVCIGDREPEDVVDGVDARLARVGISCRIGR